MDIEGLIDADGNGIPDIIESIPGDEDAITEQCPYSIGSAKAKAWWNQVAVEAKEIGEWNGKELASGGANSGDGDFQYLTDKFRIYYGHDKATAERIAGSIKAKLYG